MSLFHRVTHAFSRVAKKTTAVTVKAVQKTVVRPAQFVGRQFTKEGFRHQLGVATEVGKVAIPIADAAVTYLAGPVVGEGFNYAATRLQQQTARASMRGQHMDHHELNQKARAIANRTFKYGQIGIGVGGLAASAESLIQGTGSVSRLLGSTGSLLKTAAGLLPRQAPPQVGIPMEGREPLFDMEAARDGSLVDPSQGQAPQGGPDLGLILFLGLAAAA